MKAKIDKDWQENYSIIIDDDQLYWGAGLIEDVIISSLALLEEYPELENANEWRKLYDNHHTDSPDELDALEVGTELNILMQD